MRRVGLVLGLVSLASAGCGLSTATGPEQRCTVVLGQTSSSSDATVGDTIQNCGPQTSPNRPVTTTTTN